MSKYKINKSRSEADLEASNKEPEVKQSLAQILKRYQKPMSLFYRPGLQNHNYSLNNISKDNKGIVMPESNSNLEEVYTTSYKESGYLEKEDLLLK